MNSHGENWLQYTDGAGELNIAGVSYGRQGRGARIAYAISASRFGLILIGATAHGICWIGLHESGAYLESELHRDFPSAAVAHDDDELRDTSKRVIGFIGGSWDRLYLPLDIRATPFQFAVWRELCTIPPGSTRAYGEIARRLGKPEAARAVGHANGSNPLAIVIPCHRAIGADGRLTGYRWGVEFKRKLLEYERFTGRRPQG